MCYTRIYPKVHIWYSTDLHLSHFLTCNMQCQMEVNSCFCVLRSDLWWPDTRSQWNYRESWLSPWLPKLCQLYMDHSHWRAE